MAAALFSATHCLKTAVFLRDRYPRTKDDMVVDADTEVFKSFPSIAFGKKILEPGSTVAGPDSLTAVLAGDNNRLSISPSCFST